MKFSFLEVTWKVIDNIYEIDTLKQENINESWETDISTLILLEESNTMYVNDLDKLYVRIVYALLQKGYVCASNPINLPDNNFYFSYSAGKCKNVTYKRGNAFVSFINFKSKFGMEYLPHDERYEILAYAIDKGREGKSLGSDAYSEFLTYMLGSKEKFANFKIARKDYPVLTNDFLKVAKQNVSAYQYYEAGTYDLLWYYDIISSYPSHLLCDTPYGDFKRYESIEAVPKNYYYYVTFDYWKLNVKETGIDCIYFNGVAHEFKGKKNVTEGTITLTKDIWELALENYDFKYLIIEVNALKTKKGKFNKFVYDNVFLGKEQEGRKHIAKYNKLIANAFVGYTGRNTEFSNSVATIKEGSFAIEQIKASSDPVYQPIYDFVLGRSKRHFVSTIREHKKKVVYANTDGFFSRDKIDVRLLNESYTYEIGRYKERNVFDHTYIECINGYVTVDQNGEIENTISGLMLEDVITPEQYQKKDFFYTIDQITKDGKLMKQKIYAKVKLA